MLPSTLPFGHLSARTLGAHADAAPIRDARVQAHLSACARCRTRLQELRAVADATRGLPGPRPADDMLARIHARIAAGERVLLPHVAGVGSEGVAPIAISDRARRGRRAAAVAAVLLVAALTAWATLMRPAGELIAGDLSGDLHFTPAAPRDGDSITVTFRAPAALARHGQLTLRARLRTAWDEAYDHGTHQQALATLRRGRDGAYRGAFRLPRGVVFAAFAVEDSAARYVDHRGRRLWELLVHGPDGRPTAGALQQYEYDLMGRNMEAAFEVARRRAALYPDSPGEWATVYFHEKINLGREAERTIPAHRARLAALHQRWAAQSEVPFSVAEGMLSYAVQITDRGDALGDSVRAVWTPRRRALAASAPAAASLDPARTRFGWWRINDVAMRGADSARGAVVMAESYWQAGGARDAMGAQLGAQIARFAKDTTGVRVRWADRQAIATPAHAEHAFAELAEIPALRPAAMTRLAALAARLLVPDASRRPLESSAATAAAADSARARRVLGMLSDARLAAGDTAGAREVLVRATADGWDPMLFAKAAATHLALGDTASAVPLLARVAAEPSTPASRVDSLARIATRAVGATRWTRLVSAAAGTMRAVLLASAVRDGLPADIPLVDAAGRRRTLRQLAAGRVAVVTFWSPTCAPSRHQLSALDSLGARLARRGMALIPIGEREASATTAEVLRAQRVTTPVYYDAAAAARRAFGQWATPDYYVVDAAGRVRFRHSDLAHVLAQAVAVAGE